MSFIKRLKKVAYPSGFLKVVAEFCRFQSSCGRELVIGHMNGNHVFLKKANK